MLFLQHMLLLQHSRMKGPTRNLTRRERQIMDVLFERGRATAAEIHAALPDPPSYSAVRAALKVMEKKGHIRYEIDRLRYVWTPSITRAQARTTELRRIVRTFFEGSPENALAALLDQTAMKLTDETKARLKALIDKAETDNAEKGTK